jgi:hypothetical protein
MEPFRRLANRAVAARDDNALRASSYCFGRQLRRVPWCLSEINRCGEPTRLEPFLNPRPLLPESTAVRRRVDDHSHGKRLTEQSTNKKGAP